MSEENITNQQPLIRYVNRQQMSWRAVDVGTLVSEDHPARAIGTLIGRLDLSPFYRAIESSVARFPHIHKRRITAKLLVLGGKAAPYPFTSLIRQIGRHCGLPATASTSIS